MGNEKKGISGRKLDDFDKSALEILAKDFASNFLDGRNLLAPSHRVNELGLYNADDSILLYLKKKIEDYFKNKGINGKYSVVFGYQGVEGFSIDVGYFLRVDPKLNNCPQEF